MLIIQLRLRIMYNVRQINQEANTVKCNNNLDMEEVFKCTKIKKII